MYSVVVVTDSNNNFLLADLYSSCMTDYGGEIKLYKHTREYQSIIYQICVTVSCSVILHVPVP